MDEHEEAEDVRRKTKGAEGPEWTEHYRGVRYHFDSSGHLWWRFPSTDDALSNARVFASSGHEEIVNELLKLRPDGGSCRITETARVITKVPTHTRPEGMPVVVSDLHQPILFEHVDVLGSSLSPMDIWTGFPDGAKYTYAAGKVWWKDPSDGCRRLANEPMPPSLARVMSAVKPEGGSFRVTENGSAFTLIIPQPMPPGLKDQFERLSPVQKNLLWVKMEGASRLPVFIGRYTQGFTLRPQRSLTAELPKEVSRRLAEFIKSFGQPGSRAEAPTPVGKEELVPDFKDDIEEEAND